MDGRKLIELDLFFSSKDVCSSDARGGELSGEGGGGEIGRAARRDEEKCDSAYEAGMNN